VNDKILATESNINPLELKVIHSMHSVWLKCPTMHVCCWQHIK